MYICNISSELPPSTRGTVYTCTCDTGKLHYTCTCLGDDGTLAAIFVAWVYPQNTVAFHGGCQEKISEIVGENINGRLLGSLG